ncbi:OprO/OprP family phosphate-selective porin [Arenimonas sp.]|uniref:OprO/OprP family phosphate-selective porin n=1 Tax=Arenimonas sp. TaxID=1872635 RepID=UPI0039E2856A
MKLMQKLLAAAVLAALSTPAFAEISFDVIGGSEVTFEGLLQADTYWYNSDVANLNAATGDGEEDFDFRRAELIFKGKGPGQWNWVVGYDAKDKKFLDANIQYKFTGFTSVTVGQFKQPNSLEELSSTRHNDFISKAMNTNMQGIARRMGVGVTTGGDDWTVTGSWFTREMTRNRAGGDGFGVRGAWAPILNEGGFLHLGLSYVDFEAADYTQAINANRDNKARLRVRPDADITGVRLVDTGTFTDADRIRTWGAEASWVHGPLKIQGEYMGTRISRTAHDNFSGNGWYVSGVWNVTGETWTWKNGTIATPLPNDPSKGMWQLGLRYDRVDLNDGLVYGGTEHNLIVGANYYWHSNFKFALNYVKVNSERGLIPINDDPSIIEFRAQIYW